MLEIVVRNWSGVLATALVASFISLIFVAAVQAQDDTETYMLLENRFGELCTMCEAMVLCRSDGNVSLDAVLENPDAEFTLYHFQTKTFWGQVATIWDYLIRWIEPVTSEQRPVVVYARQGGAEAVDRLDATAFLSRDPGTIRVADREIDRVTEEWRNADGVAMGSCQRIALRDGLAAFAAE